MMAQIQPDHLKNHGSGPVIGNGFSVIGDNDHLLNL